MIHYATEVAKGERAANIQDLASTTLEEAIHQDTGIVIDFHRKHLAFAGPLSGACVQAAWTRGPVFHSIDFYDELAQWTATEVIEGIGRCVENCI